MDSLGMSVTDRLEEPLFALGMRRLRLYSRLAACGLMLIGVALAGEGPRQFLPGRVRNLDEIPVGQLRERLGLLNQSARERALAWLGEFHFTEHDCRALRVDSEGGVYYADEFSLPPSDLGPEPSSVSLMASVPVSPFPASLVLHSRPGAENVIYLNFCGESVTKTAWNTDLARTTIPAVAFSTDSDFTTFSEAEQLAIRRMWQRVAEDYAPFNVDVTTERPITFTTRTAHALVTRNTDENGLVNPASNSGGVAYVGVFGKSTYATYRPAWIYYNNLSSEESFVAEGISHEIGHNLGLSHDGKTDGTEYYGGHGSGQTSWGPIMGTGYGRNVSQWSKGDYYQANNTQDDLATIAAKLAYRADDHGDTSATATFLGVASDGVVSSTTPESDPAQTNLANRGVLGRNADVDVFAFASGTGSIDLAVDPWVVPGSSWRGGNVDVSLTLYNDHGELVATNNPADGTAARIAVSVVEGSYSLHIQGSGAGNPTAASPTGYTRYGSLGQYFIHGRVVPTGYVIPPQAEAVVEDLLRTLTGLKTVTVTYSDNAGMDVASLGDGDLRMTGPNGYDRLAKLVSVDLMTNGSPRVAVYGFDAGSGAVWSTADNGTYAVYLEGGQVKDVEGAWAQPRQLGQFVVNVPRPVYEATMEVDPGWTLQPLWQYGQPTYSGIGPRNGATGSKILAYNLSGPYENRLALKYATTPAIDCRGAANLTLVFQRWLRLRGNDTALIQVTTNGTSWVDLWRTSRSVSDTAWVEVQYPLPAQFAGSATLQIRWGLTSNSSQNDIGWNLDDVQLMAGGKLDTAPPEVQIAVSDVTMEGSPSHTFTLTLTDETAIRVASLGSSNLVVVGPSGYTNYAEYVGVDTPSDGTPRIATYSVPAPGGTWDAADNGAYQVILQEGEIADTLNNLAPEILLGTFQSAIGTAKFLLAATVNNPGWGSLSSTGGVFRAGELVEITAAPQRYFEFSRWVGDRETNLNPLSIQMTSNVTIQAVFQESMTTNHPTPLWWLAAQGVTNNFEEFVAQVGTNGLPLWESYVAGLDPSNSESRLQLRSSAGVPQVLEWTTAEARLYTLYSSTNLLEGFMPVPDAMDLPATQNTYTNGLDPGAGQQFFKLSVRKP